MCLPSIWRLFGREVEGNPAGCQCGVSTGSEPFRGRRVANSLADVEALALGGRLGRVSRGGRGRSRCAARVRHRRHRRWHRTAHRLDVVLDQRCNLVSLETSLIFVKIYLKRNVCPTMWEYMPKSTNTVLKLYNLLFFLSFRQLKLIIIHVSRLTYIYNNITTK